MQLFDSTASAAFILALVVAGNVYGQDSGTATSTASDAADVNKPSAEGAGLVARQWRSATDWQAWQNSGHWRWVLSPVSHHFRYSDEHRYVWAIGFERQRGDNWIAGASYFSNSFGQPSSFMYVGKRFPALFDEPQLFGQVSAGLMYGYRGKFQRKVPLNVRGFSPGALLSMGWQFTPRLAATTHMLGDAGVMIQLSYDLN